MCIRDRWIYYPSASGGMQSPIDVCTEEVLFDPELRHNPLELSYWRASAALAAAADDDDEDGGGGAGGGSSREKLVLVNTGNTARLDVVNNSSCKLAGTFDCRVRIQIHTEIGFGLTWQIEWPFSSKQRNPCS